MSQKTDPILARVNASPSQNLIEVTDVGQGLVWALNEENASWFRGVGAPTSFWANFRAIFTSIRLQATFGN